MKLLRMDDIDRLIFFQCLFLLTSIVSAVLYMIFYKNMTETESLIWIFSQMVLVGRVIFLHRQVVSLGKVRSKS